MPETTNFTRVDYDNIRTIAPRGLSAEDCHILEDTCRSVNPKVIVEIGGQYGCSSMLFGLISKDIGSHLYTVEVKPRKTWYDNMRKVGVEEYTTLVPGASPWLDHTIIPKPIDYLFIDGAHVMRWVLVDYHYWERFVPIGGAVAFHDINSGHCTRDVRGAIDLIMKDDHKHMEKIAEGIERRGGVMVWKKRQ